MNEITDKINDLFEKTNISESKSDNIESEIKLCYVNRIYIQDWQACIFGIIL